MGYESILLCRKDMIKIWSGNKKRPAIGHEWSEDFSSDFFVFRGFTYLYKYLIFNYLSCFYLIDLLY